jgi:hypothetical protein
MSSKIEEIIKDGNERTDTVSITLSVIESVIFKFAKGHYDDLKVMSDSNNNCIDALKALVSIVYKHEVNTFDLYRCVTQVYNEWVVDSDKYLFMRELFDKSNQELFVKNNRKETISMNDVILDMLSFIRLITVVDIELKYKINFNNVDPCL